ncbi:MAG: hypothetical protein KJO42_14005 [Silicimonas sp.]|nr:hypothetical protein [Silicimonas sp.]NNF90855.1 hypothetical protein [Boseongicola sp.]RZW04434.1 MAG: hypothetical protein EX266_10380 [Paracoccaceae bacterium]NND22770.1 hypothetical protein [Silicimonas sp.]NND41425.1 hypothetical protein [Silicimonas sp.]
MSDARRLLLAVLYAAWVMVFVYAFFAYARAPYEGAGFPDGLNKPAVYLGWQGIAGMLAIAVFGVGWGWPKGSAVRGLAVVPLVIAGLHLLAIAVVIFWAEGL